MEFCRYMEAQINFPGIPSYSLSTQKGARPFLVFSLDHILPVLQEIETLCKQNNWIALGCIAYDAAPAFDSAFHVHTPSDQQWPLIAFLVGSPHPPFILPTTYPLNWNPSWVAGITQEDYFHTVKIIQEHIRNGASYQVNYSFPLLTQDFIDPQLLYANFLARHRREFFFFLQKEGHFSVLSLSPELFFFRQGTLIQTKPMKGTRPRGWNMKDEERIIEELRSSPKERAENVMIVDLIRNDLGKIAKIGTVQVTHLCTIERYPTVLQMTSTIEASVPDLLSFGDILKALFPCGSVTGAPKIKTMELIASLESYSRQFYCGACGILFPNGDAIWNVAIRTLLFDWSNRQIIYPVGSGITTSSEGEKEYQECLWKSINVHQSPQEFALITTLRWTPQEGLFLWGYHRERLKEACLFFDYPFFEDRIQHEIDSLIQNWKNPQRIRILIFANGSYRIEHNDLDLNHNPIQRVGIVQLSQSTQTPFYAYKTTRRHHYEAAKKQVPSADDVILINPSQELTETTMANIALAIDGGLYTPPVECGLLPGVMRRYLLEQGVITEKRLFVSDLYRATTIYLMNSVRGIWPVTKLDYPIVTL